MIRYEHPSEATSQGLDDRIDTLYDRLAQDRLDPILYKRTLNALRVLQRQEMEDLRSELSAQQIEGDREFRALMVEINEVLKDLECPRQTRRAK